MQDWEIKRKKLKKKEKGSNVTENLWYKANHVMNYLSDKKGEQNYRLAWANAKWKKTYK